MQQPLCKIRQNPCGFPRWKDMRGLFALLGLSLLASGCGGGSPTNPNPKAKTFSGTTLIMRCPDTAFAAAITQPARSWATRTGATITLLTGNMMPGDDTDVGILTVAEVGAWADRGELARVASTLRLADHPFQWTGVLPIYREQLSEWGGQAQAVPLAGDGSVIVYRADRLADAKFIAAFRKTLGRNPDVPTSWEEFADLAIQFSRFSGHPSLPAMTGHETADLFCRIAACYDRPATSNPMAGREGMLSLLFDVKTAAPRLNAPAFAATGAWFARLAAGKCFASPIPEGKKSDPVAALNDAALLGVLTLADLARLPRENGMVPARFGIAALPGTKQCYDPGKGMISLHRAKLHSLFRRRPAWRCSHALRKAGCRLRPARRAGRSGTESGDRGHAGSWRGAIPDGAASKPIGCRSGTAMASMRSKRSTCRQPCSSMCAGRDDTRARVSRAGPAGSIGRR